MPWYIPLLIFLARICDVSIGTVRMILVLSGRRYAAAILGFFEVGIWVLAVSGVLEYLSLQNWIAVVAYAGGFATGVLVGMTIEDRLALGFRMVRVVNTEPGSGLSRVLRDRGYRVTRLDGHGREGPVEIAFTVVRRRSLTELEALIDEHAPRAFVTIERIDRTSGGSLEGAENGERGRWLRPRALFAGMLK